MKINEVEALVGITRKNIRFYEAEGLLSPRRNSQNGYRDYGETEVEVLRRIMKGEPVGTLFVPRENHLRFRNQWLAFGSKISGQLIVDDGLAKALRQKGSCSILPVGITRVEGNFDSGDTVSVLDQEGHELARGMTNYSAEDLELIKGCKTGQIEEKIGYKHYDEVIHRDNLVVL